MKFSISQSNFSRVLQVVSKGAATRSTLPILSGIFIEASDGAITVEATDLNTSIKCIASALVEEEGRVVIPAKLLLDVIKNLPDEAVHISYDDTDTATILCNTSSFSVKTLPADDFPGFPLIDSQEEITLPFTTFSHMVSKVTRAASKEEARAILMGVLIEVLDQKIRMVATDSYRLALAEESFEGQISKDGAADENTTTLDFSAVIAAAFLQELASLPTSEEPITLGLTENQIIATYGDTTFINRRIEGNFPQYRVLLPKEWKTRVHIPTKSLSDGIKRSSLLSGKNTPVVIHIHPESQTIQLSSVTQDVGQAHETLGAEIEGEELTIGFKVQYFQEGLTAISDAQVYLEFTDPMRPGIIRVGESDEYLYLIMPTRLDRY